MNLNVYEKTRYQNIYRHKKNKNYIIMISKPVKSSVSRINNDKIWKLEDAIKIRDNPKIKLQKGAEVKYKDGFDELWNKFMYCNKYELKQAYNTYHKKEKIYNKYFKGKFKQVSKITKYQIIDFVDKQDTTNKMKNNLIKDLKIFFNWCVREEFLLINPIANLPKYKVEKTEMRYWLENDISKFLKYLNDVIEKSDDVKEKEMAYRVKIFTLISFVLGDRTGETRALSFGDIDFDKKIINIKHSIEYDPNSDSFVSDTKTYHSQRQIYVTDKILNEIKNYKYYLINELDYNINNDTLIFLNHKSNKPFSDSALRKVFYKYIELAEVPKIRLYDLRHTYVATMMAEEKELYLISERLGHINYSTTVNKYGHLTNKIRKEIAETTDKYY